MKTTDEMYNDIKAEYEQRTGLSVTDGGDLALRLYTFAAQLYSMQVQTEFVTRQAFPQTAQDEYLDYHAQMRGLERAESTYAHGEIIFGISGTAESAISIDEGVVCATQAGVEFVTTGSGIISAGTSTCTIPAKAKNAGRSGNVPAGSIVNMLQAPVGISYCMNKDNFSGGSDKESDDDLRSRVIGSYKKLPNGANKAYYETVAMDVDGVAAATVLPKERGLGTVDVIIADESGVPPDLLVQAVQDKLQEQREICVDIKVSAPETVKVNIAAQIKPESDYTFSDVSGRVENAIKEHFSGRLLSQDVLLAKLANVIFAVAGVGNYKIISPSADVSIGSNQLPVLGTLTITQMA